jgi:hypothetical protein
MNAMARACCCLQVGHEYFSQSGSNSRALAPVVSEPQFPTNKDCLARACSFELVDPEKLRQQTKPESKRHLRDVSVPAVGKRFRGGVASDRAEKQVVRLFPNFCKYLRERAKFNVFKNVETNRQIDSVLRKFGESFISYVITVNRNLGEIV